MRRYRNGMVVRVGGRPWGKAKLPVYFPYSASDGRICMELAYTFSAVYVTRLNPCHLHQTDDC